MQKEFNLRLTVPADARGSQQPHIKIAVAGARDKIKKAKRQK